MVKKLISNGRRIKELRTNSSSELPQKELAPLCGISERTLRRMENENLRVSILILKRLANVLKVRLDEIAFGTCGSTLVTQINVEAALSKGKESEPETTVIPRHTTASLRPVYTAQALYELAEGSMKVIPHVLIDAPATQLAMIKECLALLKAVSDRRWSCGAPVTADAHDDADFPEVSRRARLAELSVLLKGHDIRIAADVETYHYPKSEASWLEGQKFCWHLVIAFAPPRGEYEEEAVTVPFDAGCDLVLSSEMPF